MLIDPHTAVAVAAARARARRDTATAPMVALATAHPAKFPDAVERATGVRPPLPPALAEIMDKPRADHGAAQRCRRGRALCPRPGAARRRAA